MTSTYGRYDWDSAKQASIDFLNKIKKTFEEEDDDQTYRSFLHIMARYGKNHNDIEQVYQEVKALFKNDPGLSIEFRKFLSEKKKRKFQEQSSDTDSKKPCFRTMEHNPYAQKLFKCEDDRFEFDMLSKHMESAIDHAERLVNDYKNSSSCENPSKVVEKYFTVHDRRCIEKLYGEYGCNMMGLLWSNPFAAVNNCILNRLKQKFDDLTKWGSRKREIWNNVYKQYYPKAVDHRSFYAEKQVVRNPSAESTVLNMDSGNSAVEEEKSTVQNPESVNSNSDSHDKSC